MTEIVGPSGVVIDIDPGMAACLVDAGHARYVEAATPVVAPEAPAEPEPSGESDVPPVGEEPPATPVVAPEAPRGNASRDEFAAYATGLGIEFEEGATRDEIRALVSKE